MAGENGTGRKRSEMSLCGKVGDRKLINFGSGYGDLDFQAER